MPCSMRGYDIENINNIKVFNRWESTGKWISIGIGRVTNAQMGIHLLWELTGDLSWAGFQKFWIEFEYQNIIMTSEQTETSFFF